MRFLPIMMLCAALFGQMAPVQAQNATFDVQKAVDYANHDGVSLQADIYQWA